MKIIFATKRGLQLLVEKHTFCKFTSFSLSLFQCNLEVTPEALQAIAEDAMKRKTGARGLRAILVRYGHLFFMYFFLWEDSPPLTIHAIAAKKSCTI